MGNMLMRSSKLFGFVLSFEAIQNRRSTTIAEQYCVRLGMPFYGREELNESLSSILST